MKMRPPYNLKCNNLLFLYNIGYLVNVWPKWYKMDTCGFFCHVIWLMWGQNVILTPRQTYGMGKEATWSRLVLCWPKKEPCHHYFFVFQKIQANNLNPNVDYLFEALFSLMWFKLKVIKKHLKGKKKISRKSIKTFVVWSKKN